MQPEKPPVDLDHVRETTDGDVTFTRELFDIYLSDTRDRLAELEELARAHEQGRQYQLDAIGRVAHTIKGSSANVGAKQMRRLASGLEDAIANNRPEETAHYYQKLCDEFARVRDFITDYLKLRGE